MDVFRIWWLLFVLMRPSLAKVPTYKLNDGNHMPAIALGTALGFNENGIVKSQKKQLRDVVLQAIDVGYRHFDTAAVYHTEEELGEAVRMKIEAGNIGREDVFITSKLWNTQHRREQVPEAVRVTLSKIGLDYVDLYLMHWPVGLNEDYSFSEVDYMETWRGLEDAQQLGLVRSIGVSNFNHQQLARVIREGRVKPAALEIEIHPQITQTDLVEYAQSQGLVVMGYSPFGSLVKRYGQNSTGPKIDNPILVQIAEKYGKTTTQVVLRWHVDRKIVPLPKTLTYSRLKQNINIFDFRLNEEDIQKINSFDEKTRYNLPSFWQTHPYYPFEKTDTPVADPFVAHRKK